MQRLGKTNIQIIRDEAGDVLAVAKYYLMEKHCLSDGRETFNYWDTGLREQLKRGEVSIVQTVFQPHFDVYLSAAVWADLRKRFPDLRAFSRNRNSMLLSLGIKLDPWPEPDLVRSTPRSVFSPTPTLGYLGPLEGYSETQGTLDFAAT